MASVCLLGFLTLAAVVTLGVMFLGGHLVLYNERTTNQHDERQ